MVSYLKFMAAIFSAALVIGACKKPAAETASSAKDLYTYVGAQKGNYFRYWMEGQGNTAKVWRAGCPDASKLTISDCKIEPESLAKATFLKLLDRFLLTDFIGSLKHNLDVFSGLLAKQKDPESPIHKNFSAAVVNIEQALSYATNIAAHEQDFVDKVIGSSSPTFHVPDDSSVEFEQYKVPEFYLAKVFQAASNPNAQLTPPLETRLYDWTHMGGSIFVSWSKDVSADADSNQCWSGGVSKISNQSEYENADVPVCCSINQNASWKMSPPSMYEVIVEKWQGCARGKSQCLRLQFRKAGDVGGNNPQLVCNFVGHDSVFATIGDLKSVLGGLLGQFGATR